MRGRAAGGQGPRAGQGPRRGPHYPGPGATPREGAGGGAPLREGAGGGDCHRARGAGEGCRRARGPGDGPRAALGGGGGAARQGAGDGEPRARKGAGGGHTQGRRRGGEERQGEGGKGSSPRGPNPAITVSKTSPRGERERWRRGGCCAGKSNERKGEEREEGARMGEAQAPGVHRAGPGRARLGRGLGQKPTTHATTDRTPIANRNPK
jgi:hypothetical protein